MENATTQRDRLFRCDIECDAGRSRALTYRVKAVADVSRNSERLDN
jgi:hypothetical protein